MDFWTFFFTGLSAMATAGLLVCTIIGFIYIRKQISIAKNKDILSDFQKEISQFMYDRYENNVQCHSEVMKIIADCLIKHDNDYKEKIRLDNEYGTCDFNLIIANALKPYKDEISNRNIPNITYYEWWLEKNYNVFKKIIDSDDYKKIGNYCDIYSDITKEIFENVYHLPNLSDSEKSDLRSSINKKIENEIQNYYSNYERIQDKFIKFLKKLAKDKKVL